MITPKEIFLSEESNSFVWSLKKTDVFDVKYIRADYSKIGFIQGLVFACAFLAHEHDQPDMATELWNSTGYANKDVIHASEFDVARFRKAISTLPKGII